MACSSLGSLTKGRGAGQLIADALADRIGRKWLIVSGMIVQVVALAMVAFGHGFGVWLAAAILLGAGTAMVYPTLLGGLIADAFDIPAAVAVVAAPTAASGLIVAVPMRGTDHTTAR